MASAHAQESTEPVLRLFACDDLLGRLYCCLDNARDRQAFRHSTSACYRSLAINSHITSCEIVNTGAPGAAAATAMLEAFPRPAQLKTLTIDTSGLPCTILPRLLSPEGAAARARVQSVSTFVYKWNGRLDAIWAATLPLLFPRLREPHSHQPSCGCSLALARAIITKDAVSTLAAQLHGVTRLQLTETALADFDALHALATWHSLTHLELCYREPEEGGIFTVAPLRALPRLCSMSLRGPGVCADGLEECLERLPLRSLCIEDVFFPCPAPKLQSATLQQLDAHLNATYPALCREELPRLEVMLLRGLSIHHEVLGTFEDQLEQLQPVVASLASGFGVEVPPAGSPEQGGAAHRHFVVSVEAGKDTQHAAEEVLPAVSPEQGEAAQGASARPAAARRDFVVSFEAGKDAQPAAEEVPCLHAVLQLLGTVSPALAGAERVCVRGMAVDREALHLLARLFPGQEVLAHSVRLAADCGESVARDILPRLCFC